MKKILLNKFTILGALALAVVLFFMRSPDAVHVADSIADQAVSVTEGNSPAPATTAQKKDGRYHNAAFGFSFDLPETYTVGELPLDADTGGKTFIFQDKEHAEHGVQVVVMPFDEDASVVTPARIMKDLPDLRVTVAEQIAVGEGKEGSGLLFSSNAPEWGGKSREAWFVKGGGLYQVSTYASNSAFLEKVIATWRFE